MGRKDWMYRNYIHFRRRFPKDFDYCPITYILPADYGRFTCDQSEERDFKQLWIVKPCNMACGKGIKVVDKNSQVKNKNNTIISR